MDLFNKRFAFTLSEVMVTLTLIGFIATMTLSTVGSSIQQRARLSEFRAAYSKMEAALKSVSIDEGKVYSCYNCPSSSDITKYGLSISGTCSNKKNSMRRIKCCICSCNGCNQIL